MEQRPEIKRENVKTLFESPYLRVADLQYAPGKHYYDATRRDMENLTAIKSDQEFEAMLADAVSCFVILDGEGEEPKLLLSYEFRYPAGQYLLSVPAGLIDEEDRERPDVLVSTAIREIREETGLEVEPEGLIGVYTDYYDEYPGGDKAQTILFFFALKVVGGTLSEGDSEILELKWFAPERIPPLVNRQHEDAWRDARENRRGVVR